MVSNESVSWEAALGTIDVSVAGKVIGTTTTKSIKVPDGLNHLWAYSPAYVSDFSALGSDQGRAIIKGNAVTRPVELPLGGSGSELVTASCAPNNARWFTDLGVRVIPGNTLEVDFESNGEDTGTPQAAISLVFSAKPPKFGWFEYETREVQITAVDEAGVLQFQDPGTGSAKFLDVPGDAILDPGMDRIFACLSGDGAALGAAYGAMRFTANGIIVDQELVFGSLGGQNVDEPVGHFAVTDFHSLNWNLKKGNTIKVDGLVGGVDPGTVSMMAAFGTRVPAPGR